MPVCRSFVGGGGAEESGFVQGPPDELQGRSASPSRESARHRDRRLTGQVEGERQVEKRTQRVDILAAQPAVVAPITGAAIGLVGVTRTSNDRQRSR